MIINKLSDCKTVDDFNGFSKNLNVSKRSGRFTYNDGKKTRSYTMNQIVSKWNQCIKKSESDLKNGTNEEWKALREKINEEVATIDQLNSTPRKNSLGARFKRGAGNLLFSLTHLGPGKSTIISNVKKKHTDVIKTLLNQISKESSNQWSLAGRKGSDQISNYSRHVENQFIANHCSFSDVLENEEMLSQVFAHPLITKAFISYARREDLQDVLDSHLTMVAQNIFNKPFHSIDDLENAFIDQGHTLIEFLEGEIDFDFNNELFESKSLREALVSYAKSNDCEDFLFFHLTWVLLYQIAANKKQLIRDFPVPENLSKAIENIFEKHGRSVREIIETGFMDAFMEPLPDSIKNAFEISLVKALNEERVEEETEVIVDLALDHAKEGQHIAEKLGLDRNLDDTALRKATQKSLLKFHPDKKSDSEDLAKLATALIEMIDKGTYKHYKKAFESNNS